MIQGMYAAATGLMAVEDRQAVVANNISNASTPGFRRQDPVQKGFYSVFSQEMRKPFHFDINKAPGGGVKIEETFTDTNPGVISRTGNSLDVALQGPGYIAVDTPQGERYTRAGHFMLDAQGQLCTADGYRVQNVSGGGGIVARGGTLNISRDGRVLVDGQPVGQLRVVEFADPHGLTREGYNYFAASEQAAQSVRPAGNTVVEHESLEMSNVSLPYEMVKMMVGVRAYAANQKVITTLDETTTKLIEQVGMPL